MKAGLEVIMLFLCTAPLCVSAEVESQLVLREKVDIVTASSIAESKGVPVSEGSRLAGPQWIRTSEEGGAHFDCDKGVLRLGAASAVYVDKDAKMEIQEGSVLYDGLAGNRLCSKISDKSVSISGDAGFVNISQEAGQGQKLVMVGAVAGRTKVRIGDRTHELGPGEVLVVSSKGQEISGHFNLPKQLESSSLLSGFKTALPSARAIEKASRRYASLESRGFVRQSRPSQFEGKASSQLTTRSVSSRQDSHSEHGNSTAQASPASRDFLTGGAGGKPGSNPGLDTVSRAGWATLVDLDGLQSRSLVIYKNKHSKNPTPPRPPKDPRDPHTPSPRPDLRK